MVDWTQYQVAGVMPVGGPWSQVGPVKPADIGTRTALLSPDGTLSWVRVGGAYPKGGVLLDLYPVPSEEPSVTCEQCGKEHWQPADAVLCCVGPCVICRKEKRDPPNPAIEGIKVCAEHRLNVHTEAQFIELYQRVVEQAVIELDKANEERTEPNEWPAGQRWNELAGSSQASFMRRARETLSVDHDDFLTKVREWPWSSRGLERIEAIFEAGGGTDVEP
jgi:hypothetical protein